MERYAHLELKRGGDSTALMNLGIKLAECSLVDDAWRVASGTKHAVHSELVACAIARHWSARGDAHGPELLAEGLQLVTAGPRRSLRERMLEPDAPPQDAAQRQCLVEIDAELTGSLWSISCWSGGSQRARVLAAIAAAMNNETDREVVFALALQAASEVTSSPSQEATALAMMRAMIDAGRPDLAEQAISKHPYCVRKEVFAAYCACTLPDEALRLAQRSGMFADVKSVMLVAAAFIRLHRLDEAVLAVDAFEHMLSRDEARARALAAVAAAAPAPERAAAFAQAHRAAVALGSNYERNEALKHLLGEMISIGRLDLAERVLTDLDSFPGHDRAEAVERLVKAYCDASQPDAAVRVFSRWRPSDALHNEEPPAIAIAAAFLQTGRFEDAVRQLELPVDGGGVDGLIYLTARAMTSCPEVAADLRLDALYALVHVAAWVREDWSELQALLSEPDHIGRPTSA